MSSGGTGGAGYSIAGQTGTQVIAVVITVAWCGAVSWVLYRLVDLTVGLRVSSEDEQRGLDITAHGEAAYHS